MGFNKDRASFIQQMTEMFFSFIQSIIDKFKGDKKNV